MSIPSALLPSPDEIKCAAWKYAGYKRFSRFVGFSPNFFMARQFRTLNARVILAMQDELVELEEELNKLDDELSTRNALDIHNGSFRLETERPRHELIWDLQKRLKIYSWYLHNLCVVFETHILDEYLCSYNQIGNRTEVSSRDVNSVKIWLSRYPNAIQDAEKGYLDTGEDLVYVLPKPDRPWLHTKFSKVAYKFFRRRPTEASAFDSEHTFLHQEERSAKILTRTLLVMGLLMLIAPLWILEFVHGSTNRLAVITGFIVLFLWLVAFGTAARPFESLAATAG
jgi:hypothetical protein